MNHCRVLQLQCPPLGSDTVKEADGGGVTDPGFPELAAPSPLPHLGAATAVGLGLD
jgi:hypothetical protein